MFGACFTAIATSQPGLGTGPSRTDSFVPTSSNYRLTAIRYEVGSP